MSLKIIWQGIVVLNTVLGLFGSLAAILGFLKSKSIAEHLAKGQDVFYIKQERESIIGDLQCLANLINTDKFGSKERQQLNNIIIDLKGKYPKGLASESQHVLEAFAQEDQTKLRLATQELIAAIRRL